jgi:hypothetical protein
MASLLSFVVIYFWEKTVNCLNAIYPCPKGPMSCYYEFLILERAVIFVNDIYPFGKEAILLLFV